MLSKAERMLKKVKENLNYPTYLRISKRGVPHLIIDINGITHSICYFGGHRSFRVFYPWPSYEPQQKFDFKLWNDVVNYFKRI